MISAEERRYLFWLASTRWRDQGHIVEMGPWLGGSTYCLAAGMQAAAAAGGGRTTPHKLHVFDNFVWRGFMAGRGGPDLAEGECFEPGFRANTADHADRLVVHRAWLPDETAPDDPELAAIRDPVPNDAALVQWDPEQPVEILFVDGAKSWQGMITLLETFAAGLIPGTSLLVFQDYKYWGEYWVAVIVELLADVLGFEHQLRENTVTFRLQRTLDAARVRALPRFEDLTPARLAELIDAAGARLAAHGEPIDRLIVELTKPRMLIHKGDQPAALHCFRAIEASWPLLGRGANLEVARRWLRGVTGAALPPDHRSRARRATDRLLRPLRR
jgi:hypothetical protein